MKKIIFTLLLILVGITIASAEEVRDTFHSTFIGTYHYIDNKTGKFGDFEMFQRKSDGKLAFCIEPGTPLTETEYLGYYNLSNDELAKKVGLTKNLLEQISLLTYIGYEGDMNNTQWIVAIQAKIWQILGRDFSFTSRNSQDNPWNYVISIPSEIQEKMNQIEELISDYNQKKNLDEKKFSFSIGEKYVYEELGLTDYQIVGNDENVKKDGNKLIFNATTATSKTITLVKQANKFQNPFMVYHSNKGQDLILTGNIPDQKITFSYEILEGEIQIQKFDFDNRACLSQGNATLNGAIIGLFHANGTKIKEITIQNCKGIFSSLPFGEYYIQELKAPEGYLLDSKKYPVSISKEKRSQSITIYNKVKKAEIKINKKFLYENAIEINEVGAEFEIIAKNSNKAIATLKTDSFGNASITLPYGNYILRQIKGKEGYHFTEDTVISILENANSVLYYTVINKPILKNIKVKKKDLETNDIIKIKDIEFKLYDITNKKYICQNKECIYKTNAEGEIVIEDLYYSEYQLEEIQKFLPGYLWNKEPLSFTINQESPNITTLDFFNQRVKGKIEIHKTNQNKEPLENVEFQLFAKEDIFENGKLIYQKDELIEILITDKNGISISNILPLGKYYLKETSRLNSYVPNETIYDFSLNYSNDLTPLVIEPIKIVNYKVPETLKNNSFLFVMPFSIGVLLIIHEKKKYLSF